MNVIDENVPEGQRELLQKRHIKLRLIGQDLGRKGMKDAEVFPLLHQLDRPTFFTLDGDFYNRRLCHREYCLVYLDVDDERVAELVLRLLRHKRLNTRAKRMGCVIRVQAMGLALWQVDQNRELHILWGGTDKKPR